MTEATLDSTPPPEPARWRTNLILFLATVASVFVTGVLTQGSGLHEEAGGAAKSFAATYLVRESLVRGGQFAATLLVILVAHELGHYVAARLHKVDASLP